MAKDRLELHNKLKSILGNNNVYYQPPSSITLKYPAIVYKLAAIDVKAANNSAYSLDNRYELTLIEREPDTGVAEKLIKELNARLSRPFTYDNLYQKTFSLTY